MAAVRFERATRTYPGNDSPAVDGLNLDIADGEFLALVGPSGCGKSTALRMLAGLEEVDSGKIFIDGRDVSHLSAGDRDVAMVFQNYALYSHMSVADNMGFALKIAGVDTDETRRRVTEAAHVLDLSAYLHQRPKTLSGGQRQRVAMGRAIVREPKVFLMDEPLSTLEPTLRVQTRTQIASLQRRLGVTTVYATDDRVEAMTMGDRVAVLANGVLQQCDSPRRVYDHPNNVFVAGYLGSPPMNLFDVPVDDAGITFGTARLPAGFGAAAAGGRVTLGVRAEDLDIAGQGLPVIVEVVDELEDDAYVYGFVDGPDVTDRAIVVRVAGRTPPRKGTRIHLAPRQDRVHYFDPGTGERLRG